jgi:uncharacterized protein YwgA
MDRGQIALKLTIDSLGLTFQIDEFRDRLILQKAVYLVQAAGVHLGYYYQWYLHGPYCPSLTRDEYAVAADINAGLDESKGWRLDAISLDKLGGLSAIFNESDRGKLATKLELLASVHFLLKRQQIPDNSTTEITTVLKKFGKNFTEQEIKNAMRELRKYGLLTG